MDYLKERIEIYNQAGRMAKEAGMTFYYHNHFHEFQLFGGKTIMDIIMDETDPDLVKLELDRDLDAERARRRWQELLPALTARASATVSRRDSGAPTTRYRRRWAGDRRSRSGGRLPTC